MKKIPLTGKRGEGKFALVDDEDYEELSKYKWYVETRGYVVRATTVNGIDKRIFMHRVVMRAPEGMQVDHIDGNKLNNQKSNLRLCTARQNLCNVPPSKNKKYSRYKGVTWDKTRNKWTVRIKDNGKHILVGRFDDEIEAAKAYNEKALEIQGEFAYLNDLSDIPEGYTPKRIVKKTSSRFRGVIWHKQMGKWVARVWYQGRNHHVGTFDTEIEAAKAYNAKALELLGDKAKLNIIPEEEEDAE